MVTLDSSSLHTTLHFTPLPHHFTHSPLHFTESNVPHTPGSKDFVIPGVALTSLSASAMTNNKVDIASVRDVPSSSVEANGELSPVAMELVRLKMEVPIVSDKATPTTADLTDIREELPLEGTSPPPPLATPPLGTPPPLATPPRGTPPPLGATPQRADEDDGISVPPVESPKDNVAGRVLKVSSYV